MNPRGQMLVFLVVGFSLVSLSAVEAQPTGEVVVASDLELLSLDGLSGGGRVTWTIRGQQATVLRTKIIGMFDEQTTIPRGFEFALQNTGATPGTVNNGVLDSPEAGTFLDYLENEIEGTLGGLFTGTEFRYVLVTRADRAQRDLPAERSSSGLVGTSGTTAQNIEIEFIFNAEDVSSDIVFRQADEALVQALHAVFAFDTGTEDFQAVSCPPWCYPFPALGGWRVVGPPPITFNYSGQFLWHGSNTSTPWVDTGVYPDNATEVTFYSTVGALETPVDLRFATSGNLSFEHTGGTSAGDALVVEVSLDQTSWTPVTAVNDGDGLAAVDTVPLAELRTSVYDLGPWVGNRVYVRLNFTANGDGTTGGPGHFLRNLRIQGPSQFEGTIDFRHVDLVLGFLSFSDFRTQRANPHLIRTPIGEVFFYSATYEAGDAPQDAARYAAFDALENPQILFVLLIVSAWLLRFLQDKVYERYRLKHPPALRAAGTRVKWLHWIGRIVVLLLVLFYFLPTALIGGVLFVSGQALWALSIGSILAVTFFTFFWYERVARMIPLDSRTASSGGLLFSELPPPPPPVLEERSSRLTCAHCEMSIENPASAYTCACGFSYHPEHARELGTCVSCGRPMEVTAQEEKRMVTVTCPSCNEVQVIPEEADLAVTKCGHCGLVLQEIARGYNYLIIAEEPNIAFEWFNRVVRRGVPGLCMSTIFPEKLRREYGLADVELYWLSDTSPGPRTLDPRRLDFEIMRAVSNFIKNNRGSALVLDGLEYLIVENSFDRVLKFIKKVNDLASVHDATMFVPVTTTGLGPEEATLLRKEFDRVEAVSPGS